ncbi:MAG: PhzF family phenazine biosynthesis protein [Rubrivivax sp.]
MTRRFDQLDVFSAEALRGNPLAVVHDAAGLDDARMAAFARWTHLSETTFLLPPTDALADYRVRIFTPGGELPFAGHPTLGSCHAWLAAGGQPRHAGVVVQQCGVGLVTVRRDGARLAFEAPPLRRSGPLDAGMLRQISAALGLGEGAIRAHQWVDNGPGWCAVLLDSAERVLGVRPDWARLGELKLGVVGAHPAGAEAQFEVRALIGGGNYEDPVTGSLNASVAQWLIGAHLAPPCYVAAQGAALRRAGRVFISSESGKVWVGGDVTTCIRGEVTL